MSLHISSSSNIVVCSHCTLQASLVQAILYLRVLLFIFIYFTFSCITCIDCYATIISAYAPSMTNPDQTKEEFYELLCQTLQKIPPTDKVIILGDFNARVGDDFTSWPIALGKFGRDKSNSNGEQLLSICTQFNLAITNTFFKMPDHWYYSWQHPRSKRCHLLDYVITRRVDLADIRSTRAMRGADCSTDHYLIRSLCNLHIKPPRRKIGPTPVKKLNVSKLADSEMQKVLMAHMETNMMNLSYNGTINNQWETFCEKVYKTSVDTLGHTTRTHQDWFDENDAEMLSLLEERRRTHDACLSQHTRNQKLRYTQAKSKLQKSYEQFKMPGGTRKLMNYNS